MESTRDKILRVAHDLFYRRGFHSVGLDAIIAEVGVTKTTFYNHFQSKDDLVSEVLRWHDRWWRDTFRQLLIKHGGPTPRGQLAAVFDGLDEAMSKGEFNGCFFVNVAVQFPLPSDPAHQTAAAHKQAMEQILVELATYAGATDPRALARELSVVMEGAYITRQVTGDPASTQAAQRIGELLLAKYLPDPGERRKR